eukprot:gene14267-16528_t
MNLLDLVNWVECDVGEEETWEQMAPILRELSEAYLLLPRDVRGAELALGSLHELHRRAPALRRVVVVSRAPFWNVKKEYESCEAWKQVEDATQAY